jgi:hypothetical protein
MASLTYRQHPDGTIEHVATRTFFNGELDEKGNPVSDTEVARAYREWLAAGNEPEEVRP